jgi:hypothetical protein
MPGKPTHNLTRDGVDKCAEFIMAQLRRKKAHCDVYVSKRGEIRIRRVEEYDCTRAIPLPKDDLLQSYMVKSRISSAELTAYIRDDLAERLASFPAAVIARGA